MLSQNNRTQEPIAFPRELSPTHPDRVRLIKQMHADELTAAESPLCVMHTKVMPDGQIITSLVGVEPAHAQVLLQHVKKHITNALAGKIRTPSPDALTSAA
jgi:hypothetical protein